MILAEEEISDVSLSTFYVFDKENAGARSLRLAAEAVRRGHGGSRMQRLRRTRLQRVRRRRLPEAAEEAAVSGLGPSGSASSSSNLRSRLRLRERASFRDTLLTRSASHRGEHRQAA